MTTLFDSGSVHLQREISCLAAALESQRDDLIGEQVITARASQARYESLAIPRASLEAASWQHVNRAISTIEVGHVPATDEIDEVWIARERAEQGMSLNETLDGYRCKQRVIRDRFLRITIDLGTSPAALSTGLGLLADTADICASQLLIARKEFDDKQNNRSDDAVDGFLIDLLRGELSANTIRQDAIVYGLRGNVRYFVVRGRTGRGYTAQQLRDETQSQTWMNDHSGVVVVVNDEVLGLVPRYPSEITRGVIAVGSATGVFEASLSHIHAGRVLETAVQFGLSGVVTQADLSLRLAIFNEPEVNVIMIDRYFGPLEAEGEFGLVLESTISEFLSSGGELKRAARSLHVHPNTLKHRLLRFQDLTNCDLNDPKTLAELWWAVEARAMEPSRVNADSIAQL